MKTIITGSEGFIGSNFRTELLKNNENQVISYKEDLRNLIKLDGIKPDIIFHLAADATEGRSQFTPFSALDNNLVAYLNLLIPSIKNGLKKIILTSSMSVYGAQQTPFSEDMIPKPEDIYAMAKSGMETLKMIKLK